MTLTLWRTYTKAIAQLLGAVIVAVLPLLADISQFGPSEWVNVALVAVGSAVVWNTANHPDWPYGKLIGSALITALTTLNSFLTGGGVTTVELLQIVLALITTLVVGVIPNGQTQPVVTQSNMNPEGPLNS